MNLLELNHVEKSFENLSVLKDISISIGEGEIREINAAQVRDNA